jgi:uncharacterized spore protein YtfJ
MGITERIQQDFRARIVYDEPVERDGMTVIPAARIVGGGGGGSDGQGGEGGGFGMSATPSGAWIIQGDRARWKPAIDLMVLVTGGYVVAVTYFFFSWLTERSRAKA